MQQHLRKLPRHSNTNISIKATENRPEATAAITTAAAIATTPTERGCSNNNNSISRHRAVHCK
jgi:hypothetical protein